MPVRSWARRPQLRPGLRADDHRQPQGTSVADFDLRHSPYIALVRREDVETTPDDPVRAAIYAPGFR